MKKGLYILGAIILLLCLTNPSLKRFQEFIPSKYVGNCGGESLEVSRKSNFLIFSIYGYRYKCEVNKYDYKDFDGECLGILFNFYDVNGKVLSGYTMDEKGVLHK